MPQQSVTINLAAAPNGVLANFLNTVAPVFNVASNLTTSGARAYGLAGTGIDGALTVYTGLVFTDDHSLRFTMEVAGGSLTGNFAITATLCHNGQTGASERYYLLNYTPYNGNYGVLYYNGSGYVPTQTASSGALAAFGLGQPVKAAVERVGTTIRARFWQGATEPSTWSINAADDRLTGGRAGFRENSDAGTGNSVGVYDITIAGNVAAGALTGLNVTIGAVNGQGKYPVTIDAVPSGASLGTVTLSPSNSDGSVTGIGANWLYTPAPTPAPHAVTLTATSGSVQGQATLTVPGTDHDPPTISTITIAANGLSAAIVLSETCTGTTGFTFFVAGQARAAPVTGTGANRTATFASVVYMGQAVTYNYSGDGITDQNGNHPAAVSGVAVTNNSTVPVPTTPTIMPSEAELEVGESTDLTVSGFTGGYVTYQSVPGTGSGTVTAGGHVTGTSAGTFMVSATGVANPAQIASATFTVSGYSPPSGGGLTQNQAAQLALCAQMSALYLQMTETVGGIPRFTQFALSAFLPPFVAANVAEWTISADAVSQDFNASTETQTVSARAETLTGHFLTPAEIAAAGLEIAYIEGTTAPTFEQIEDATFYPMQVVLNNGLTTRANSVIQVGAGGNVTDLEAGTYQRVVRVVAQPTVVRVVGAFTLNG